MITMSPEKQQEITQENTQEKKQDKKQKGRLRRIIDGIVTVFLVLAAALLVFVMISAARGSIVSIFGRSVLKVVTGSMEPTILTDDYIIIDRNATTNLSVGDIISFYSTDPQIAGMVVTHRIVGILDDGSYLTRGDANTKNDDPVFEDQIIGRYVGKARILRLAASFGNSKKLIVLGVLLVIFASSVFEVKSISGLWKSIRDEQSEKRRKQQKEKEEQIEALKRQAVEEYLKNNQPENGAEERNEQKEKAP